MRVVLQRVREASVEVDGKIVGQIGPGLLVFLGVGKGDSEHDAIFLADRVLGLRIFEDSAGKMNLSVKDVQGEILVVSQFTLYGNTLKGGVPASTRLLLQTKLACSMSSFCKSCAAAASRSNLGSLGRG
jgi:D-tyrosyl-tRNA(Tyr) deacylase